MVWLRSGLCISCNVYAGLHINRDNSGLRAGWDFKGSANNPVISLLIGTHFTAMEVNPRDYWDVATHFFASLLPKMGLHATLLARPRSKPLSPTYPQDKKLSLPLFESGAEWEQEQCQPLYLSLLIVGALLQVYHIYFKITSLYQIAFMYFFHAFSTSFPSTFPQGDFSPLWPFKRQFKCSPIYVKP